MHLIASCAKEFILFFSANRFFNLIEIERSLDFNVNFIDFIKNSTNFRFNCCYFFHLFLHFQLHLTLRANKTTATTNQRK